MFVSFGDYPVSLEVTFMAKEFGDGGVGAAYAGIHVAANPLGGPPSAAVFPMYVVINTGEIC